MIAKLRFQRRGKLAAYFGGLAVKHLRKIREVVAQVEHHFIVVQHAIAAGLLFAGVGFEEDVVGVCVGKALLLQVGHGFLQLVVVAVGDVEDLYPERICEVEKVHRTRHRLGGLLHAPLLPIFFGELQILQDLHAAVWAVVQRGFIDVGDDREGFT